MQLIPAIDIRDGGCVRLLQGDFDKERRYEVTPVALAARYAAAGARRIHVVDLDGARSGTDAQHEVIGELAAQAGAAVQVGGGIRSAAQIRRLLDAGVERVVIGSAAVTDVATTRDWFARFGPERIVLALDVALDVDPGATGTDTGVPMVRTHGWTRGSGVSLWDAVAAYADCGLIHVLCTDVACDGTLAGPNTALYRRCVQRLPAIRWQASGGVGQADHLDALAASGVDSVIVGRALLDGRIALTPALFARTG